MVQLIHRRRARVVNSICLRYSVAVSTRNSNSIRRIRQFMKAQSFVNKSQRLFHFIVLFLLRLLKNIMERLGMEVEEKSLTKEITSRLHPAPTVHH